MYAIPLVRAGGILPWVIWLRARGRPVSEWLLAHHLPSMPERDPLQPVSYYQALSFVTFAAAQEGPDLGSRVVTPDSFLSLGAVGDAIRRSRTPRTAFANAGAAAPLHNSHASYGVSGPMADSLVQQHALVRLVQLAAHQLQQHSASVFLSICRLTELPEVADIGYDLMPHPELGLAHLVPHLGSKLRPVHSRGTAAHIPDKVLDAPLRWPADWAPPVDRAAPVGRVGRASMSESAQVLIAGWLQEGPATLEQLASAAGRSPRTVQRILLAEGTSFRQLHDKVRRDEAIVSLEKGVSSVGTIANSLGYNYQSSLTRAMRRWMEVSPSKVRQRQQRQSI